MEAKFGKRRREEKREDPASASSGSRNYTTRRRGRRVGRESIVFSTHSDRYRVPLLSRANLDMRVYTCARARSYTRAAPCRYRARARACTRCTCARCIFSYIRYKYAGYRCTTLHDLVNTLNEWFSRWMARHHGAAWSHSDAMHGERSRSKICETSCRASFDTQSPPFVFRHRLDSTSTSR